MEVTGKLYVVFEGVSNDNVLKFIVMMSIQLFEYSKNHWVNYMACELYLNKAIRSKTLKIKRSKCYGMIIIS